MSPRKEQQVPAPSSGERKHGDKKRSSSRGKNNQEKESKVRGNGQRSSSRQPHQSSDASKRYVYSAISATFFFLLFREMGWMEGNAAGLLELSSSNRLKGTKRTKKSAVYNGELDTLQSSKARTIALAGTSSAGGMQAKIDFKTQAPKQHMTRKEVMAAITAVDENSTDTDSTTARPIMYTFFEWIPPRNRGTQMSDQADLDLVREWKIAWRKAGWDPRVLTLQDAKRHSSYESYATELNKIQMLGVDGMGGNVVYNQFW